MRILGISAHYHDSAAALLVDGVPVAAVQEERFSRRKNDAAFPVAAIEWCLEEAGIEPAQLDAVVFYEKPMLKFERILTMALREWPRTYASFPHAMKNSLGRKLWVKGVIQSWLGVPGEQDPLLRAPPVARRRGLLHGADARTLRSSRPTASASGRRSR